MSRHNKTAIDAVFARNHKDFRNERRVLGVAAVVILALCLTMASPFVARAEDEIGAGQIRVLSKDLKNVEVPLKHTSVDAHISGFVARVDVTQHFVNTFDKPIEAVYVFPLPHDAAVHDMTMTIGERVVKGVIKKRGEAREIYEAARQAGKTASLLDQERPNIFTQSIANIMPGDDIKIRISYAQALPYDKGRYEFVFPMVVGPRYIPGHAIGKSGGGWAPDTDRVPDASKITPPVLKPTERSGHDIDIAVHLDAGVPVGDIRSPSHMIEIDDETDSGATIRLDERDTIPNKDLIVRYDVAGEQPGFGLVTYSDGEDGYFLLMLTPKEQYAEKEIVPREMIFIVDSSGSQSGDPLTKSKEAVKRALRGLRADDVFQVYDFNDIVTSMAPAPVPATAKNVQEAMRFVDQIRPMGGTRMLPAVQAALNYPPAEGRLRIVFMTTDGYIGNETEIIKEIHDSLGDARLFSLGVGSSVNRYLLVEMAEEGRGFSQFVRQDESTKEVVETFHKRIDAPVLTDITIDWGGLAVADVVPARVPDLFDGQPLVLFGKFTRPGSGTVRLTGTRGSGKANLTADVTFPREAGGNDAIAKMWARARIDKYSDRITSKGHTKELEEKITDLGLTHKLMTQYTSFVAVEEKIRNEGGKQTTVQVPVEMPEGVSYEGVFGEEDDLAEGSALGMAAGVSVTRSKKQMNAPAMVAPAKTRAADAAAGGSGKGHGGVAAPPPYAQTIAPDEEMIGGSSSVVLDPIAYLGISDQEKFRNALETAFAKGVAKKLEALRAGVPGKQVMVRLTLDASGKVTKVDISKDTTGKAEIAKVLKAELAKQSFPAPGHEAAIVFYVRF
ncbi:VWA domain-containing protein [bacterium]|nr:VWA domain-containing protein [bacterium]